MIKEKVLTKNRKDKKTIWENIGRKLRYTYIKLVRINDSPKKIAMGASLGIFIGIFPTFGIGIILSVFLATLFRWNKVAALLGSFIMNPFTSPFFWTFSASIGGFIFFHDRENIISQMEIINDEFFTLIFLIKNQEFSQLHLQIWEIIKNIGIPALAYLAGNTIVSLVFAFIGYLIILQLVLTYRRKRETKVTYQYDDCSER